MEEPTSWFMVFFLSEKKWAPKGKLPGVLSTSPFFALQTVIISVFFAANEIIVICWKLVIAVLDRMEFYFGKKK